MALPCSDTADQSQLGGADWAVSQVHEGSFIVRLGSPSDFILQQQKITNFANNVNFKTANKLYLVGSE